MLLLVLQHVAFLSVGLAAVRAPVRLYSSMSPRVIEEVPRLRKQFPSVLIFTHDQLRGSVASRIVDVLILIPAENFCDVSASPLRRGYRSVRDVIGAFLVGLHLALRQRQVASFFPYPRYSSRAVVLEPQGTAVVISLNWLPRLGQSQRALPIDDAQVRKERVGLCHSSQISTGTRGSLWGSESLIR